MTSTVSIISGSITSSAPDRLTPFTSMMGVEPSAMRMSRSVSFTLSSGISRKAW